MDIRSHRRRVAGFLFCGFPAKFAGGFVEGDDSSAIAPADVEQDGVAFHQWRAGDSEKAFWCAIFLFRIERPKLLAVGKIPTTHNAFGAVGINAPIGDGGSGTGSFIESEVVAVMSWIAAGPERGCFVSIEALDGFFVFNAVEYGAPKGFF